MGQKFGHKIIALTAYCLAIPLLFGSNVVLADAPYDDYFPDSTGQNAESPTDSTNRVDASQQADSSTLTPGIERASGERLASAVGHFSRSRALLIQAIKEFDKARSLARPDALIDSEQWRATLASRADELARVMSPQPRVTRSGVKFDAAPQLLDVTEGKGQ